MPISSGAGGRLMVTNAGNRRIYWPNVSTATTCKQSEQTKQQTSGAIERRLDRSKKLQQVASATTSFKRTSSALDSDKQAKKSYTVERGAGAKVAPSTVAVEQLRQLAECQLSISSDADSQESEEEENKALKMNSLGGQLVVTGAGSSGQAKAAENSNNKRALMTSNNTTNSQLSLGSLVAVGQHQAHRVAISTASNKASTGLMMSNESLLSARPSGAAQPSKSTTSLIANFCAPSSATIEHQQQQDCSTNSSTAHLAHSLNGHFSSSSTAPNSRLDISKRLNLKYVKTLIIILMAVDLMITLFVHHFAQHDTMALALVFTTYKLRFSLLNLLLSSVWFILLIGAILFDVYFILIIGSLVNFASFLLLLVVSVIHFTHRVDYNSVNLTSLLLLLFSIIVLHVYLLVMMALISYLTLAVRQRNRAMR